MSVTVERRLGEVLHESDVRVSLVAEMDDRPVGFVMGRGPTSASSAAPSSPPRWTRSASTPPTADSEVGRALLSRLFGNLATLRVEKVLTEVDWSNGELMALLTHCDFRPSSRLAFDYRVIRSVASLSR